MVVVGNATIDRKLSRMGAAAVSASGDSLPPEVRQLIADPVTWVSVFALNGTAMGTLWLMATKPGWVQAIAVPLALTVGGAIVGQVVIRRPSLRAYRGIE
jgi:hypothetical protein